MEPATTVLRALRDEMVRVDGNLDRGFGRPPRLPRGLLPLPFPENFIQSDDAGRSRYLLVDLEEDPDHDLRPRLVSVFLREMDEVTFVGERAPRADPVLRRPVDVDLVQCPRPILIGDLGAISSLEDEIVVLERAGEILVRVANLEIIGG